MRELRKQKKMTQAELGLQIGRSKSVISNYESGRKIPPVDVLAGIADVLDSSVDYLIGREKRPYVYVDGLSNLDCVIVNRLIAELSPKKDIIQDSNIRTELAADIMRRLMKK